MAHEYSATIAWSREGAVFADNRYSRAHTWTFDGGTVVPASSSPLVVRPPLSRLDAVDPEEAVVAAASACHMLFALTFLAKTGAIVEAYEDKAVGTMAKNERGKAYLARIVLRPAITFAGGTVLSDADLTDIHHRAHDECYIAHSLKGEIAVEPEPVRHV